MALASLFSVELEFLAMADQANCTFGGVVSSKWYICRRGIPVIQSSTPLHRSIPPFHSTEFIFPNEVYAVETVAMNNRVLQWTRQMELPNEIKL